MTNVPTVTVPPDLQHDWNTRREEYHRAHASNLGSNKTVMFDALTAAGVTDLRVTFDGCGDSGQIENVVAKAGDLVVELPATPITLIQTQFHDPAPIVATAPLSEALETLIYELLEATHDGWEINEGAFGDFIFDVAARTIRLEYNQRFESTEYSEHEF